MKLSQHEKHEYIKALSKMIFCKPLEDLKWENTNTLYLNIICRLHANEFSESVKDQLIEYLTKLQLSYPREKKWED